MNTIRERGVRMSTPTIYLPFSKKELKLYKEGLLLLRKNATGTSLTELDNMLEIIDEAMIENHNVISMSFPPKDQEICIKMAIEDWVNVGQMAEEEHYQYSQPHMRVQSNQWDQSMCRIIAKTADLIMEPVEQP